MNLKRVERWWLFYIVFVAIFRLVVTADRDILALNSPHDDYWYIHTAFNRIWGGSYNEMSFMHLPIYSAWLYCLHLLGIPARLAIDVGWLLAIGYLAFAIYHLTSKAWLAALTFTFLAFHPYTIVIFDKALAETFLSVISAAVIGAGIELWNCRDEGSVFRRRIALVVFAAGFALAFHTRKEGIVLVVPLLLLSCWSWVDRGRWWSNLGTQHLAIPLLIAPLMTTLLLGSILAGINYYKWGVFARYELAAPGYQRAIAAVNRIDVGRTPRHFTVTKKVLSLAYKESPTFRELQPFMEGWPGQMWISISSQETGIPGEIGNGWFYWALRNAASAAGWHSNAIVADSKYAAVADELEKGFKSGRLKKRGVALSAFLDPDVGKWMPEVPQSVFNVLQLVVRPKLQYIKFSRENASAIQFDQYVAITGRRTAPFRTVVSGWSVLPAGTLVGLGTGNTAVSWTRLSDPQRPDVPGAYAFSTSFLSSSPPTDLYYLTPDGRKGSVALSELKTGRVSTFSGDLKTAIGVDSLESNFRTRRADKWLSKLCTAYEWIGYAFCLAAIGGILSLMVRRKPLSAAVIVLALMIAVITTRVALFSIIDASSWSGLQARYMLPIIPAFACMGALGLTLMRSLCQKNKVDQFVRLKNE